MSQNRLLILVLLAVVAMAGGWYFGVATQPAQRVAMEQGRLLFPDLTAKLAGAKTIELTSKGKTTVIALKDGVWGLPDRGGWRVQDTKLRGMLTTLTELRLVEPRTASPDEYKRLGVEDPLVEKDGTATLLRLLDGADKPILSLIVGHRRMRTQGNVPEQIYARLPDEAQSWLAEGGLQADTDPLVWLDRDVLNIAHGLITRVVSTKGAETIELAREGDKLKVVKPAETPKLDEYKLDEVSRTLESLTFQDVKPAADLKGEKAGEAVFTTSDGLEITATVYHQDKDSWTRFTVAAPDRGKPEAERLNAKLAGWAFQTGAWKDKSLVPGIEDLKADPPPAAPEQAATPDAPSAPPPAPAPAPPVQEEAPKP